MTDEILLREALAEADRARLRRNKRVLRWSDLDRELALRALAEIADGKSTDE